jgi:hypothetical protein
MIFAMKKTSDVFGISNTILPDSYIDRGGLDEEISRLLARPMHIALRGESKCGKSWLRQRTIPESITVQCRLGKGTIDIYRDALAQLDVRLEVEKTQQRSIKGRVEAQGELGVKLLGKLGIKVEGNADSSGSTKTQRVGHDISDLSFVAEIIKASGRRLVIEDFHYLAISERKAFAFDLKALWDYGLFVVIIGVWSESNMLLYLNPDLSGRVHELSIAWTEDELKGVLHRGGDALHLRFSGRFETVAAHDCFGNVGILQSLALKTLDHLKIYENQSSLREIDDIDALESTAMDYAEQLNPLYQQFAKRVSSGIRNRKDSTGIYGHAMAVILEAPDDGLIKGLSIDHIFESANAREKRIQKGNLRTVLEKFESLQVDQDGRGLVLAYNDASAEITIVDRQLLLYRRYSTVKWPWEDLIAEANASGDGYGG